MDPIKIFIDDVEVECTSGDTILVAAYKNGVYIPSLCYHPALPASHSLKPDDGIFRGTTQIKGDSRETFEGCRLCLVQIDGMAELLTACDTLVREGMKVVSKSDNVARARQDSLLMVLAKHPHSCLLCLQKEGCNRTKCSPNVPESERCCELLGNCELQKVAEFIGIRDDFPKYAYRGLSKLDKLPLFKVDYNLCVGCLRCVRACNEMRGINALGFVRKDGEILVGMKASNMTDSGCRFCTACVEVCPTGAIMDKDLKSNVKDEALVPCKFNCPVGIDIPEYLRYTAAGEYDTALAVVRENVPFPHTLGHICYHSCESVCRREDVKERIAICKIERFIGAKDNGKWMEKIARKPASGKTVAVIGAGASGLAAAYFLALKGHEVTVFDKDADPGGMMRYTIPEYRLPKAVLEEDLKYLWQLGVKFEGNKRVIVKDLVDRYDSVLLATGNGISRKLRIDGVEMSGVLWGIDFLRSIRMGETVKLEGTVLVIGGGNVAADVALSARRVGAKKVTMVCIEKLEDMPAHRWLIDQAVDEGVEVHTSWGPRVVQGMDSAERERGPALTGTGYTLTGKNIQRQASGRVKGVEFIRCVSVYDENKRFSPQYDDCEIQHFDADMVIFAIGQASDNSFINIGDIKMERDFVKVDEESMTGKKGVFACGEVVSGPESVIDAIAQGRKAASGIDKYLGGDGNVYFELYDKKAPNPKIGRHEGFAKEGHIPTRKLPVARRNDFSLVFLGYGEDMARKEAARCLQCDLRLGIEPVVLPFTEKNVEAASGQKKDK